MQTDLLREIREIERKLVDEARDLISGSQLRYQQLCKDHPDRLVSIGTIERICLKYRLRFLDLRYFKNRIPDEAFQMQRHLNEVYGIQKNRCYVIAPGELFRLENREKDPILLTELYDGKFFIIHKWGREFGRLRYFQSLPLRSIPSMMISLGIIALLLAPALLPLAGNTEMPLSVFIFGFLIMWAGLVSYTAFLSISQNIFPTSLIWKSKFLD